MGVPLFSLTTTFRFATLYQGIQVYKCHLHRALKSIDITQLHGNASGTLCNALQLAEKRQNLNPKHKNAKPESIHPLALLIGLLHGTAFGRLRLTLLPPSSSGASCEGTEHQAAQSRGDGFRV